MCRRAVVLLTLACLGLPAAAGAQDSKSADLARQLGQLLDAKKMDSIAAADPAAPGTFLAALYFPGTQLLVISAKYFSPDLLASRLAKKEYRDAYIDLNAGALADSKIFIMDTFADGLVAKPRGDNPADSVERAGTTLAFDGDWKKNKQSEEEYMKAFTDSDTAYAHLLQLLIDKLKSSGT